MQNEIGGVVPAVVAVGFAIVMACTLGCATAPPSLPDQIQARGKAAPTIIDDPERAAEARAAFEGMYDAATEFEASAATTRADLLSLHHDPSATPEAFRSAIAAMRERHRPMLLELINHRIEAAASTTDREWKRLQKD
jgi:hypothetical protein